MVYLKGSSLHKCLVDLPEDDDRQAGWPLVIGLHGGGSNPENLINIWDHLPKRKFIFAVPQAPYPHFNEKELIFDWALWPSGSGEVIARATELTETYCANVVEQLVDQYEVKDVFLMGFSQGAIFAYLAGIKYHQLFRGIVILSGPGLLAPLKNPFANAAGPNWLPEELIQEAKDLRVFITHGKDDQAAIFELGIKSTQILKRHGFEVTFRDFDGGHSYPPKSILSDISDWLGE